jgi:hypothetical protein
LIMTPVAHFIIFMKRVTAYGAFVCYIYKTQRLSI